jgi:hypothetical protein
MEANIWLFNHNCRLRLYNSFSLRENKKHRGGMRVRALHALSFCAWGIKFITNGCIYQIIEEAIIA